MIWSLSPLWLIMAIAVVMILSFIMSMALTAIIGADGFGPAVTMSILTVGFFGSIYGLNLYGVRLAEPQEGAFVGLVGSFIVLMAALVMKAIAARV